MKNKLISIAVHLIAGLCAFGMDSGSLKQIDAYRQILERDSCDEYKIGLIKDLMPEKFNVNIILRYKEKRGDKNVTITTNPLCSALEEGCLGVAGWLIEKKCNVNDRHVVGWSGPYDFFYNADYADRISPLYFALTMMEDFSDDEMRRPYLSIAKK